MKEASQVAVLNFATHIPVEYNPAVCTGCNSCVDACQNDVLAPNAVEGRNPIVLFPDECWYCGSCIMECPEKDKEAIKVIYPTSVNLQWKRKATGELFRVGMANLPAPNMTPPVGGWVALRKTEK
jgi:NAD-dependent dihydropyrimidine dehydrogenase PreA subunit